jgi:hypothetical protein
METALASNQDRIEQHSQEEKPDLVAKINTKNRKSTEKGLNGLGDEVEKVHVSGYLFVWVLKEILSRAPKLQVIQVVPAYFCYLRKSHLSLCEKKKILLEEGYEEPDRAWTKMERAFVTERFRKVREFLLNLTPKAKQRLNRLERCKEYAKMVEMLKKYYALDPFQREEERWQEITQEQLAGEYGLGCCRYVSTRINGMLYYIDPILSDAYEAGRIAARMERRISKTEKAEGRDPAKKMGIPQLPPGLRKKDIPKVKKFLEAARDGLLGDLKREHVEIFQQRFGIEAILDFKGMVTEIKICPTQKLREVGVANGHVSRERVRQVTVVLLKKIDCIRRKMPRQI